MRHVGRLSMRRAARRRPWAGVAWWKTSRTCWAQWSATSTLIVRLICREGLTESLLLPLREPMTRGAQEKPDVVEGIPLASTVAQCVLPGATAYLTWGIAGECDDVKGIQHAGGILEQAKQWRSCCPWKGSSVAIRTPHGSLLRARPASSCTRCQTCPAPGPTSGPWDAPPRKSGPRCR